MQQDLVHAIKSNPKYHEMVSKRATFSWLLAVVMLAIYYGFVLVIAFNKQVLAQPLFAGPPASVATVGIPVGTSVILLAFLLTGIYVYRANTVFDKLNNEIKEEVL